MMSQGNFSAHNYSGENDLLNYCIFLLFLKTLIYFSERKRGIIKEFVIVEEL